MWCDLAAFRLEAGKRTCTAPPNEVTSDCPSKQRDLQRQQAGHPKHMDQGRPDQQQDRLAPAAQPEISATELQAEQRQNLNLSAALDAADMYFRGPMPPDVRNKPMNYLRAKDFARTIDMEVDPELRLVLGTRPKMGTKAEVTPAQFLDSLRQVLMEVTGLHASEDPQAAWEAHKQEALAMFETRQQQYNLLKMEQGETEFEGGNRGQEEYLDKIVELYVPKDHEYSAHIRQSLQAINANPDWTFHAKEWMLRRMIFGLVGAPEEGMDEEAVKKLIPRPRDWRPMDVYQRRPELKTKLQTDMWIEDVEEGSSKPAFKPGARGDGEE